MLADLTFIIYKRYDFIIFVKGTTKRNIKRKLLSLKA